MNNAPRWLTIAGDVDGAIAAALASGAGFLSWSPTFTKDALIAAGIAGTIGVGLNLIARIFYGAPPVAPTPPPTAGSGS